MKRFPGLAALAVLAELSMRPWAPAAAQTQQQRDWCYSESATDDQTIDGCTALIDHAGLSGRELAIVHYDRGLSYENKNQLALALEDFSQAIVLDPSYADAYDDRGNVLFKMKEYDRAIEDYNKAIAAKPSALAYSNRGYVYYVMGRVDQALQDLSQSLAMSQSSGRTYVNRALVYLAKHDCADALQDLLSAKRLNWKFDAERSTARSQCGAMMDPLVAP